MKMLTILYEDAKYWIFSALQLSEPPQNTIEEALKDSATSTAAGLVLAAMIAGVLGLAYWIHEILFLVAIVFSLQFVAATVISLIRGFLKWLLYILLRISTFTR